MGTDRWEKYKEACRCGAGHFVLNHCSPDHPYAKPDQYWWEPLIECANCREQYELKVQKRQLVLVDKSTKVPVGGPLLERL